MSGRNDSERVEPLGGRLGAVLHSEGISYKPRSGEIGMCLRVGRMGPQVRMERDSTTRSGARAAGVERPRPLERRCFSAQTSLGTERGSDACSGEHEGRWQTERCAGCVERAGPV